MLLLIFPFYANGDFMHLLFIIYSLFKEHISLLRWLYPNSLVLFVLIVL